MTRSDEPLFDPRIADWLQEDPNSAPDQALETILAAVPSISQRHRVAVPWRLNSMPNFTKLAAAAVIGAIAFGVYLNLPGRDDIGSPIPSPSPTATARPTLAPSPTPNALLDTANWTSYTSAQYDFKIGHPSDWTVEPADRAWDLERDAANWLSTATDSFYSPGLAGLGVRVSAWSVPFEYVNDNQTWEQVEAWIQTYCEAAGGTTTCASIHDRATRLCIEIRDCHPGLLLSSDDSDTQAFFSGGLYHGQMVVVSVWRTQNDPSVAPYGGGRKLLEAFLATMCVWPEDARPQPPEDCLAE
jgi:hypothetical protein